MWNYSVFSFLFIFLFVSFIWKTMKSCSIKKKQMILQLSKLRKKKKLSNVKEKRYLKEVLSFSFFVSSGSRRWRVWKAQAKSFRSNKVHISFFLHVCFCIFFWDDFVSFRFALRIYLHQSVRKWFSCQFVWVNPLSS